VTSSAKPGLVNVGLCRVRSVMTMAGTACWALAWVQAAPCHRAAQGRDEQPAAEISTMMGKGLRDHVSGARQ